VKAWLLLIGPQLYSSVQLQLLLTHILPMLKL
jgi:hypothetical protein